MYKVNFAETKETLFDGAKFRIIYQAQSGVACSFYRTVIFIISYVFIWVKQLSMDNGTLSSLKYCFRAKKKTCSDYNVEDFNVTYHKLKKKLFDPLYDSKYK